MGAALCSGACDAHTPCCSKKNFLLSKMLHANTYDEIPTMQDCCDMCTNHPVWLLEYEPRARGGRCVLMKASAVHRRWRRREHWADRVWGARRQYVRATATKGRMTAADNRNNILDFGFCHRLQPVERGTKYC